LNIHYTTQFKKDYKRIKKQNKDPDQLKVVIEKLVAGKKLEPKYRDKKNMVLHSRKPKLFSTILLQLRSTILIIQMMNIAILILDFPRKAASWFFGTPKETRIFA